MAFPELWLRLPAWVNDYFREKETFFRTREERMGLVLELAGLNFKNNTGGPFAAAVFEIETGRLVAPGVNLVLSTNCSILHAEMVAITIAQQVVGNFDLGAEGMPAMELVTTTEPCAMCLGAIPWSGVRCLTCGATGEDAVAIGFDEGTKPAEWVKSLEERGISVIRKICREEAGKVLQDYLASGGVIYNARQGKAG